MAEMKWNIQFNFCDEEFIVPQESLDRLLKIYEAMELQVEAYTDEYHIINNGTLIGRIIPA